MRDGEQRGRDEVERRLGSNVRDAMLADGENTVVVSALMSFLAVTRMQGLVRSLKRAFCKLGGGASG